MPEFMVEAILAFLYCLVAGIGYKVAEVRTGDSGYNNPAVFFSGALWPVVFPAYLGSIMVTSLNSQSRKSRAERRREAEITEAKHKRELARIAAEELAINERSLNIQ